MPARIQWNFTINVTGGPTLSGSRSVEVEAYDVISVAVAPDATDFEVEIQPGEAAGQVSVLTITSDHYEDDFIYKVNSAAATDEVVLNQPQVLVGGAVGLTDDAPTALFFSRNLAAGEPVATVQILVGRDATP